MKEKPALLHAVMESYRRLQGRHDYIVVEGAGSPAEINLRERDIANMGFAETADCPVILIADIDKGGVFAHLVGTLALLSETERHRVAGFVINKFRGDIELCCNPGWRGWNRRLVSRYWACCLTCTGSTSTRRTQFPVTRTWKPGKTP